MAILCLHMKQDKGACGYVSSAQVRLCKLHDQTFCEGYTPKYVWGIWTATVQETQQEPLTLKDLTEMKSAMAWERHVKPLIVFRLDHKSTGMLYKGQHPPANGSYITHASGPAPVPGMWLLTFVGCDLEVARTDCSAVGPLLSFANWPQQGSHFWKMRSQPLFLCLWAGPPIGWLYACWGAWADAIFRDHRPKLAPPGPSSRGWGGTQVSPWEVP